MMTNNTFSNNINSSKKSFWQRFKSVFSPEVEQPQMDNLNQEDVVVESEADDHQKQFEGIGRIYKINIVDDISITKKHFLESISKIGAYFEELGELDGALEQKTNAIFDIVKTKVSHIRAYIEAVFQGEKDSTETEHNTKKQIFEDAKKGYNSQIAYSEQVRESYRWNYKNFSLVMGVVYIIVAILLIIADIPLSVKLTKEGFVLKEWWEVIAMSLGIALCTVYVKIYYDEFIAHPIEKSVTQFKPKNLPGVDQNEQELKSIKTTWLVRFSVKTFILLFSLVTIMALGIFRFQFFEGQVKRSFNATNTTNTTGGLTYNTPSGSGNNLYTDYFDWKTKTAFILITILFPVIGGVCASLGADKIQNYRELKQTDKNCALKQQVYLNSLKDLNEVEKRLKNCANYLKWCSEEGNFIIEYTSFFISHYVHGYERGIIKANLGKDLFNKAEELRKKLIAKQAFSVTQSISSNDLYAEFQKQIKEQSK